MKSRELTNTLALAQEIIEVACKIIQNPQKKGGYMCVTDGRGAIILVSLVGNLADKEKAAKYFVLCQEKALRLAAHEGEVSSWQSRDKAKNQWGGAIWAGKYILSFSGLPEHWDEACMICLARSHSVYTLSDRGLGKIVKISENPYVRTMLERYSQAVIA